MFPGIIEEVGTIDRISRGASSAHLRVSCHLVTEGTRVGDSIAVNCVCLTATRVEKDGFEADVMEETVRRSSLASLKNGSRVNLERAMPVDGRFGGHIVAGHVDTTGTIRDIKKEEMAVVYQIEVSAQGGAGAGNAAGLSTGGSIGAAHTSGDGPTGSNPMRYIVDKGSVAIDGISLTVAGVSEKSFTVSIIPHTTSQTTLSDRKPGDIVNIETDIIGKYVEKLLMGERESGGSTNNRNNGTGTLSGDFDKAREFLTENGF